MDYQKHYDRLIDRAKRRQLNGYSESHHIQPKCMGGSDDQSNLVNLTPEEHYLAHQLLVKIYPEHQGLVFAAIMMTSNRSTNKLYGWIKRRMSSIASTKTGSLHQNHGRKWITDGDKNRIIRISDPMPNGWSFGRTEHFKKHAPSAETKKKIADGNRGKKMSEEAKRKIAAYRLGKKHSAATKQKMSESGRR